MIILNKPFYFIRHGETEWNQKRIYMGFKDIPLNETGIKQAKKCALLLKTVKIASIVSSPLQRAYQTAEIIAAALKKPVKIIEDLKECGWGVMEGQPKDEKITDDWVDGKPHEGAEKIEELEARVLIAMEKALDMPGPVLLVSHGAVYYAICKILSIPYLSMRNCQLVYHKPPTDSLRSWKVYCTDEKKSN